MHPYDLPLEEFMLLPEYVAGWPTKHSLRKRDDPTGVVDSEGRVWVPVQLTTGAWARRHIFTL
jgi:hypothetical protein